MKKILANSALLVATPLVFLGLWELTALLLGVKPLSLTEDPYVGFSDASPLFTTTRGEDGREWMITRESKLPWFNRQSFPREKAADTYRIFSLGGSTTFGRPYEDATSFSGWLREMLPEADASKKWEVINCGGVSYAAYRVAKLTEELARYRPDLLIVYSGHNEFLEERTYREVREMPAFIREANAVLDKTRAFSGLKRLYRRVAPESPTLSETATPSRSLPAEVQTVLENTIGPESYHRDDVLREKVLEHYRFSLRRIAELGKAAGARVIFVSTPSNEKDCTPFKSEFVGESDDTLFVLSLLARGDSLERMDSLEAAFLRFDSAVTLEPRHAGALYRKGKAAFALGNAVDAESLLRRAMDEDVCPLRALTPMRGIVREVAEATGSLFLDFETVLKEDCRARYGHDVLGEEYFLDHVHIDPNGHRLLASRIMEMMKREALLSPRPEWGRTAEQVVAERVMGRLSDHEQGKALHDLAKVLNWAGKHEDAARIAGQALELDTLDLNVFWSYLIYGAYLERQGMGEEALVHYRKAVRVDIHNPLSRRYLADALERYGYPEAALRQFDTLSTLLPGDGEIQSARSRLAAALHSLQGGSVISGAPERGSRAEALTYYEKGRVAASEGRNPDAINWYARALQADPGFSEAKAALMSLLQGVPERH